ncbi:hypothetical protein EVAR_11826_1 [Eumeta japonica]|uniref:Uncharacterized protein n=1 Tax=Eumeta variegata TaxID=151549 RepID=A0A4C1UPG4_EUMVA|nr:hypothetical protein EVAR_11826_1 [Eumeta japonica]
MTIKVATSRIPTSSLHSRKHHSVTLAPCSRSCERGARERGDQGKPGDGRSSPRYLHLDGRDESLFSGVIQLRRELVSPPSRSRSAAGVGTRRPRCRRRSLITAIETFPSSNRLFVTN